MIREFTTFVTSGAFISTDDSVIHIWMSKIVLTKPAVIMLYGFPGAGKTHFAAELSKTLSAAHVQGDRIRYELFESPKYDKQENEVVTHLMEYMTEEFLQAGVSVVFDVNAHRLVQRRTVRDIARKVKATPVMIWLQIDQDSAFARIAKRDRRKNNDKYAQPYDKKGFQQYIGAMQNPKHEDYMVISGKHTFNTQLGAVLKKFYELGLINAENYSSNVAKPELVNLVPNHSAGRVDISRRNISIR